MTPALLRAAMLAACASTLSAQKDLPSFDHHIPATAYGRAGAHHARCSGRVVTEDGAPIHNARVVCFDYVPYYFALPVVRTTTAEDGRFSLDVEHIGGNELLWVVSPDGAPFAVRWYDMTLVSGSHLDVGDITLTIPEKSAHEPHTFRGKVLDRDGEPVAGVLLRSFGSEDRFDPLAYTETAADGSFTLVQRGGVDDALQLFFANRYYEFEHEAGKKTASGYGRSWNLDLSGDIEIRADEYYTSSIATPDAKDVRILAHRGSQHAPVPGGHLTLAGAKYRSAQVIAQRPGYLPVELSLPKADRVTFAGTTRFTLVVSTPDGPAAGARIDLCRPGETVGQELRLETVRADDNGRVRLLGEPDRQLVGYAYLDGHVPKRFVWRGGNALELKLPARDLERTFELPEGTHSVFVRVARTFAPVATAYCKGERNLRMSLAPGAYEVTAYGDKDALAVERVVIDQESDERVVIDEDQRPVVTVKLPKLEGKESWWVHGGRRMLGGMVTKWMAYSGGGRARRSRELVATSEPVAGQQRTFQLRFPISGRFLVQAGHPDHPHRYFAPLDLALGDNVALELPALDAKARGQMPEFPELWEMGAQHGIAGPRLLLRPDRTKDTTWGVLVALPEPAAFELDRLPAGDYLLGHHLYETGFLSSTDGHHGEVPVSLTADQTTDLGKLEKDAAAVTVTVVDPEGQPVQGRLRVVDRMFDSWVRIVEEGTSLNSAMDPIPTPPSVQLVDGVAEFSNLRKQRVEFVLHGNDGSEWHFERDLGKQPDLQIVLRTRQ